MNNRVSEYKILNQWMCLKEKKKSIAAYLMEEGIKDIGIYGYGIMGKHLVRDLIGEGLLSFWVVDRQADYDECCSIVRRPDELSKLTNVDLVIVTSVLYIEEIERDLLDKGISKIISIEELVDRAYRRII